MSSNLNAKVVKEIEEHTACVIFKVGNNVTIYHFDTPPYGNLPYEGKIVVDKLRNPKRTTLIDLENEVPEEAVDMIVGHEDGYYDSYEVENKQLHNKIYNLQYPPVIECAKPVINQETKSARIFTVVLIALMAFMLFGFGYLVGLRNAAMKTQREKEQEKETEK
ncbi:MAG: hypothetical protein ACOYL8_02755 [Patescibacteria group bacterium]